MTYECMSRAPLRQSNLRACGRTRTRFARFVSNPTEPNRLALAGRTLHPGLHVGDDGQRILESRGFVPARRALQGALAVTPMRVVDPALMLDEGEKWTKLYESIFLAPRR